MAIEEVRIVRTLRLYDADVKLEGGRLTLSQATLPEAGRGNRRWRLDARFSEFHVFQSSIFEVGIGLENGETLVGDGVLSKTDGWTITLESIGTWTGVAGW